MKINLVRVCRTFQPEDLGIILYPPLGIAIMKSFLKKHHLIQIDDLDIKVIHDPELLEMIKSFNFAENQKLVEDYLNGKNNSELDKISKRLLDKFDYKNFDLIGFSLVDVNSLWIALLLSKKIKEEVNLKIVLGGNPLAIGYEGGLLKKFPFMDYIVAGLNYLPFIELVNILEDGVKNGSAISGLIYIKNNNEIHNKKDNSLEPIDKLPIPDFEGLPLDYYGSIPKESKYFLNMGKILCLQYDFIRGCPFNCSFCMGSAFKNKSVSFKQINKIVSEIGFLSKKYGTKYFIFLNNAINIDNAFLNNFCDALIRNKIKIMWSDCAVPRNIDKNLLIKMRNAGCVCLVWGLESGSAKILKNMKKGFNLEEASKTLKYSHEACIWNFVNIIVGYPHETEKDFCDTLEFIKNNIDYIDHIKVSPFRLSMSDIFNNPKDYGIEILEKKVSTEKFQFCGVFAFNEVHGLKWEEKQRETSKRYNEIYSLFFKIKKAILRDGDYMHNLFHLYEKFKDKDKVKQSLEKNSKLEVSNIYSAES